MGRTIDEDVAVVGDIDAIPKLLEVVCKTTGMGFAAVARVTEDRWVACAVRDEIDFGLGPGGELEVATTICDEIRDTGVAVIIDDVQADPLFCRHPTPAKYGFRSYISVPIRHAGVVFGTLCAIDPRPLPVSNSTAPAMFELFAELIGQHLAASDRLAVSQAALLDARQVGELRDQFIAVLGHDLRNPLASIDAAARLIGRTALEPRARELLDALHGSVGRMSGLIDDVLDLARGRLGGGLDITPAPTATLGDTLQQVVTELRLAHPDRAIEAEILVPAPIAVDEARIGQLLSNLLANAVVHGCHRAPVRVVAGVGPDGFRLTVSNAGPPIPEAARARLFQPFERAGMKPQGEGLGLGLYIASEIARGHGGVLEVASDEAETHFTFRMPVAVESAADRAAATAAE
jgi:signal transduction histidine kinase